MPLITNLDSVFQRKYNIEKILLATQQHLKQKCDSKIVSICQEISFLDPLLVLNKFSHPERHFFYFEKVEQAEAIVAFDSAMLLSIQEGNRFIKTQDFIQDCLSRTVIFGDCDLPFAGPNFFCSFNFFEENKPSSSFPQATIFLPRWQISTCHGRTILVTNFLLNCDDNIFDLAQDAQRIFNQITSEDYTDIFPLVNQNNFLSQEYVARAQEFKKSVNLALNSIAKKHLQKVVLANALDIELSQNLNIAASLNNLRHTYPNSYVFATSNSQGKVFIGASPERLIRISNETLVADILAGSAPRGKTPEEDSYLAQRLLNSIKEQHEHQVVLDFVQKRLNNLGLTLERPPQVSLVKLSNIQHLWTPITAKIPEGIHLLEILAELHPTPAVAGFPRNIALEKIRLYETFDRSLYAAPIGWIDRYGNGEFAVAIRSALIQGNSARLYAGAGIVAGSEAERELAEIQLKLQTLLQALV